MFGMQRVYELPLARDYVRHWGVAEAVRELIQNAIDSESPFEYAQHGDTFSLFSRGARLDPATLVLGRSSKADDDGAIGQFGEGYKLALVVLARCGLSVVVENDSREWRPEFRKSKQFGIETMHIIDSAMEEGIDGLRFVIRGLNDDHQQSIKDSCLLMQEPMDDAVETYMGRLLPSRPGKLYVGGLYVCDTDMEFGYDFKPEHVTLERDRSTISGWDLKWKTKELLFLTGRMDDVAEMMERGAKDTEYAHYNAPEMVKDACYRHFQKKYPGHVAVKTKEELDKLIERGMTKVVQVNAGFHSAVSESAGYRSGGFAVIPQVPAEVLRDWYEANKKYMSRLPQVAFKALIKRAEEWRNK